MAEHEQIEEHIHHAQEPFDKIVAGSMAIIAALLAVVSVLGQHFNTATLLSQQRASDQWAFFQAQRIRGYSAQMGQDVLSQLKAPPEASGKYAKDVEKYAKQTAAIQEQAKDFEKERDMAEDKAVRFHTGEVFLEVAIVLSSLAILTKRRIVYVGGVLCALFGVVYAATGFLAK
jgi:hypothetical protein